MNLDEFGFKEVGEWKRYNKIKSGIDFHISGFEHKRVIYAFVIGDEVKYVGICEKDTTSLSRRLKRYKNSEGKGNRRIAGNIRRSLEEDNLVEIFALKPELVYKYRGLEVDLVKGLENPLIKYFQPEWNIRR